ncbi:MAG: ankyrin repeat domain-containing protein [Verrucomicrobia bacterium]|nr:ankyrin repeat domain-containing protein [Verrucomicrobiota bacterium]
MKKIYCYHIALFLACVCVFSQAGAEMIVPMKKEAVFKKSHQLEILESLESRNFSKADDLLGKHFVDERGEKGVTLLWWSANVGDFEAFAYLIRKGANPLIQVADSYNVMEMAAAQDDSDFLRHALENGGNANLISQFERITPIFMAVQHNKLKNVELLLEAGAAINVADTMGRTPVLWASEMRAFRMVQLLLLKGADPSVKDAFGLQLEDSIREANIDPTDSDYPAYRKILELVPFE